MVVGCETGAVLVSSTAVSGVRGPAGTVDEAAEGEVYVSDSVAP